MAPYLVPESEVRFRASRAGGPGGQHTNKAATRVEAVWNVARSPSLDPEQRARLLERLRGRLSAAGVLRVVAAEHRSQWQNRLAALERLRALVRRALQRRPVRRPTRPPRSAAQRRLARKRRRSQLKQLRQRPSLDDQA